MDVLVDFLLNNYIWFLVISLILIFALIGYLVDTTAPKLKQEKETVKPVIKMEKAEEKVSVHPSVEAYTNEDFDAPLIDEKNT